ncbi:hypothetical protein [Flammeovirga pacifica]|uniref:Lipoprotein n=1 Tax=Flammeovirga pacifica TaxID=915059 RepID=A0A1S1YWN0_FLAPC|nr:hypothetical protein [Flammeovirga pacifica]OHX65421.1 hypothetical protein NH26_03190 [Flammeovirga pacifica]
MRQKYIYIILVGLFLIACSIKQIHRTYIGNWFEKSLDFSESIMFHDDNNLFDFILEYKFIGSGGSDFRPKEFIWLRNSNNLFDFFEITKKIGLQRLMSKEQYNRILVEEDYWGNDWKDKSLNMIVDSLILTYNSKKDSGYYYTDFWKRRCSEQNDKIVLQILKQTDSFYNLDKIQFSDKINRNDLYELMLYNVELNETKDSLELRYLTINYFDYLKSNGLEHSSYNLIHETYLNRYVLDKRDSLLRTLNYDTIPEQKYWDTRNNASWIKTYMDNGP